MSARATRNNRIAGLFVICAAIGTLLLLTLVGGGLERIGKKSIQATFTISDGAASLAPGSVVTLGGIKIGTVTTVKHADSFDSILVTMLVDRDVPLRENAKPKLVPPILGGSGVINFETLGTQQASAVSNDSVLQGESGGSPFLQGLDLSEMLSGVRVADLMDGYTIYSLFDTTKDQPDGVLGQVSTLLNGADNTRALADEFFDQAAAASENFNQFVGPEIAGVLDRAEVAFDNANSVITDVKLVSEQFAARSQKLGGTVDSIVDQDQGIPSIVRNASEVSANINKNLTADRIQEIGSSIDSATEFIQEVTVDGRKLNTEIVDTISRFRSAAANADTTLANANIQSDEILADMALTAIQLRDSAIEVRRSPWRLLYRPSDDELNFETLYDAARLYASATAELRTITGTLRAVAETTSDNLEPRELERINNLLEDAAISTERYREAEAAFIELLKQGAADAGN